MLAWIVGQIELLYGSVVQCCSRNLVVKHSKNLKFHVETLIEKTT